VSELLVVKLGGTTVAEQRGVLDELAALARRRPLVVVHGGGKRLTDWLERLGVPTSFEEGRRITDEASLEVAAAVLRGASNIELVAALRQRGCDAIGLSGVDGGLVTGRRVAGLGRVVTVGQVRRTLVDVLIAAGLVPVVAPLAVDEHGEICNVNADDLASGLARGLRARQLVLLTDTDGVRDADGERIGQLTPADAERLIRSGVIAGGMVPKIRAALSAVGTDPEVEAVIADGFASDALGRALSDPGVGTRLGHAARGGVQPVGQAGRIG
jgi:acetylglutamate kinase